jgi:uncharacterized protein (TIGR00369 family)
MMPGDANPLGNVHGGIIMKLVDEAGGIAASRHSRRNTVTVAVDSMSFLKPIYVGTLVTFEARLTYVGHTSMEVEVRVEAENLLTGEKTHTNTAYLVYVALDEHGRPTPVPPLILETEEERQMAEEAKERQRLRLERAKRMAEREASR